MANRLFIPASASADPLFDSGKLDSVAQWTAAGFVALTSILTFFGIKEGALDRLLRVDPQQALYVFCLVGVGLLCGLFSAALKPDVPVYLVWVIGAVLGLGLLSRHIYTDTIVDSSFWSRFGTAAVILTLIVAVVVGRKGLHISLVAGILIAGVAATSFGLYGAAKLSVASKAIPGDSQVTAKLTGEPVNAVEVTVAATRRDKTTAAETDSETGVTVAEPLFIEVVGVPAEGSTGGGSSLTVVGSAMLTPDLAGDIAATQTFPVDLAHWPELSVRACNQRGCTDADEKVLLQGTAPAVPYVNGTLTGDSTATSLTANVQAAGLAPGATLRVTVFQLGASAPHAALRVTLAPDESGAVTWTAVVPGATTTTAYRLQYRSCADTACDATRSVLAVYRPPPP